MMQPFQGSAQDWDALIASLPHAHLLQTWEWSQVKAAYGWKPMPFVWTGPSGECAAAAMILMRQILRRGFAARLCLLYIPKGPLFEHENDALRTLILDDLQAFAKKRGAVFLKLDPDVELGVGVPGAPDSTRSESGSRFTADLQRRGWRFSASQVQFRNTVLVDLSASEDELLGRMKQKTRYNLRLAEKKGIRVRAGTPVDLDLLYQMYAETSVRDGFVIRDEAYYRYVWQAFMRQPAGPHEPFAEPLIAEFEGEPVAAIFVFYFARRAYYLYGMSRAAHREKMPNYLLQWEGLKRAKDRGCTLYDLWGAPDEFAETDSMWGVFRFKEGLGGSVIRTLGAWDYPASPFWYNMYMRVIPRVLGLMRWRGQAQTANALE